MTTKERVPANPGAECLMCGRADGQQCDDWRDCKYTDRLGPRIQAGIGTLSLGGLLGGLVAVAVAMLAAAHHVLYADNAPAGLGMGIGGVVLGGAIAASLRRPGGRT